MSWNTGSVAVELRKIVPDIPTALSGTAINGIIDQQRHFMSNYTGVTIGSTAIGTKYQQPLLHLSASALLGTMELEGADAAKFKLGDLTIGKGRNLSSSQEKVTFYNMGMTGLHLIGKKMNFYKSNG